MSNQKHRAGGRRQNAGRKPIYEENMQERTFFVTAQMWELCQAIGEGNASAGVRIIIEDWMKAHRK